MSSEELKFIETLKNSGYKGQLDPAVFKSIPRHLMKWLSENVNSSVLLTEEEVSRLEDIKKVPFSASVSGETDSSCLSQSCKSSTDSPVSLYETDDSDILSNQGFLDVVSEESSDDDDDEIKALKKEIKTEDKKNMMLGQLRESLIKKLVEVNEETSAEEEKKDNLAQEMTAISNQLSALYVELGSTYRRLVQQAELAMPFLGCDEPATQNFLHQMIGDTLEVNFQKCVANFENLLEKQKQEAAIPISKGEQFLLDSAPTGIKLDNPEDLRVNLMTEELYNLVPRIASLHEQQLVTECEALALPGAEKLLTDVQTGKCNITLEQLKCKTEELRGDVAQLEVEVQQRLQSVRHAMEQQAQVEVVPLLLSASKELMKNFTAKQEALEKVIVYMETYVSTLLILHSMLAFQSNDISQVTSFIRETQQHVASKHSEALVRMDLMKQLQAERNEEQEQAVACNLLLKTFQNLLLGEEQSRGTSHDAMFDLMSASLRQLKMQNTHAWEEQFNNLVSKNMAVLLKNKKEVESLSEYLVPYDGIAEFPLVKYNFKDQFAAARTAVEKFLKRKELFKSNYDAEKDKINQNSQARKKLLEWVKFITHGKRPQDDESVIESSFSKGSIFREPTK